MCSVCMPATHKGQRRASDLPELELKTVCGNQTQVLCQSSKCFELRRHLSSHLFICLFSELAIKPRALCIPGNCSSTHYTPNTNLSSWLVFHSAVTEGWAGLRRGELDTRVLLSTWEAPAFRKPKERVWALLPPVCLSPGACPRGPRHPDTPVPSSLLGNSFTSTTVPATSATIQCSFFSSKYKTCLL